MKHVIILQLEMNLMYNTCMKMLSLISETKIQCYKTMQFRKYINVKKHILDYIFKASVVLYAGAKLLTLT